MSSTDQRIWLWAFFGGLFALLGATAAMLYQPDVATGLLLVAVSCTIAMMVEIMRVILR